MRYRGPQVRKDPHEILVPVALPYHVSTAEHGTNYFPSLVLALLEL